MGATTRMTVRAVLRRLKGLSKKNRANTGYKGMKKPGPHNPCGYKK
jgi:hypothetical protein